MRQFTPNTIINIDDLKKHLLIVRREGVAIDDEECFPGGRGIAAVFRDREGKLAGAITILGPSIRLSREKIRAYIPIIKKCARDISTALGYRTDEYNATIAPEQTVSKTEPIGPVV
jgi:IclR family acetate operon transcriptional repressor